MGVYSFMYVCSKVCILCVYLGGAYSENGSREDHRHIQYVPHPVAQRSRGVGENLGGERKGWVGGGRKEERKSGWIVRMC